MSRLYIGRLSHRVRERDVERFFKGYGRLNDILLKNGYGFVEFDDYRDADDAVYELNGKELCGERVVVEHARGLPRGSGDVGGGDRGGSRRDRGGYPPPSRRFGDKGANVPRYGPPVRTEYRLIVENLSSRVSWQDLKDYMRQAGEVTYADAHKQRKNEGIVEFATSSDMRAALDKLDDTEINGRTIKLVEDRPRRSSRRSRSRSRSRSRRRSRSRSRRSTRSRSRSRERRSRSKRSRSRSPSHSRSRSRSVRSRSRSRSGSSPKRAKTKSASRSKSPSKSRSRSRSPKENGDNNELPIERKSDVEDDE